MNGGEGMKKALITGITGQDRRDICKRTDPDRSNEFHQGPFICEDLSDHRRGAEHDSESGERNHNKSRKRNEDHSAW